MKTTIALTATLLIAGSIIAADSTAKDDVTNAAKKLGEKANYSWKSVSVVPENAPFKPGPSEGKTEKDGVTYFTFSFGDNTTQIYLKGDKSAVSNSDGGWQSAAELENDEGLGRFISVLVRNFKAPVAHAPELAAAAKELKKDGDAFSSDMTEEGARKQFKFGKVTDPKGSVKFWIKDGQLSKYEYKLAGKAEFNGDEFDVDRVTTVEIKEVGTTKVEVPAAAKKKLEPAPAATTAPAAKPAK